MGNCTNCKAKDVSIVSEIFEDGVAPAFLCACCSKARAEAESIEVKVFGATASKLEAK